jgi:hypothetical protein
MYVVTELSMVLDEHSYECIAMSTERKGEEDGPYDVLKRQQQLHTLPPQNNSTSTAATASRSSPPLSPSPPSIATVSVSSSSIPCPLCQVVIPLASLDTHLGSCIAAGTSHPRSRFSDAHM